jgi:multicomponent Na+:H+ antiporter subunit D
LNTSYQLVIPVLLPVFSGLLIGFIRPFEKSGLRRLLFTGTLALNVFIVLFVIIRFDMSFELFRLTERLPVFLKTDGLGRFFCALAALMFLLVGIYCPAYMRHEDNEKRFYMFFLIVLGALMGVGLSGNLMTLYFFFELTTLLSVPLVLHTMEKEAVKAAFKYLYYSIAGSSLAVIGFFFIYKYGTSLEFTPGGVLDITKMAGQESRMLTVTLLVIIGFGAKAGMFPLHSWLPDAHPVAPAPASAILSGVITKVGVFAVIRFIFYLTGSGFIRGTWVQTVWISLALFTGIMGSLLAFRAPLLKRRLAYSTISQIGYIFFGLGALTADSFIGALLLVVFHCLVKNALFLIAGIIIVKTKITEAANLAGIGRQMPFAIWCFALSSLSLMGIPPLGGFTGKWYLAMGSLAANMGLFTWLGLGVILFGSLLAAGYLLPIVFHGFFPGAGYKTDSSSHETGLSMLIPVLLLTAATVILGIFPGALISVCEGIANMLM